MWIKRHLFKKLHHFSANHIDHHTAIQTNHLTCLAFFLTAFLVVLLTSVLGALFDYSKRRNYFTKKVKCFNFQ